MPRYTVAYPLMVGEKQPITGQERVYKNTTVPVGETIELPAQAPRTLKWLATGRIKLARKAADKTPEQMAAEARDAAEELATQAEEAVAIAGELEEKAGKAGASKADKDKAKQARQHAKKLAKKAEEAAIVAQKYLTE